MDEVLKVSRSEMTTVSRVITLSAARGAGSFDGPGIGFGFTPGRVDDGDTVGLAVRAGLGAEADPGDDCGIGAKGGRTVGAAACASAAGTLRFGGGLSPRSTSAQPRVRHSVTSTLAAGSCWPHRRSLWITRLVCFVRVEEDTAGLYRMARSPPRLACCVPCRRDRRWGDAATYSSRRWSHR